jgi:NhaP-type Na+/H+ or K+/H+ antiporter
MQHVCSRSSQPNIGSVQVNAPEEIRVTVDGEALIDDGVAAVLFIVFQESHPPFSIFSYHVPTLSKIMPAGYSSD